MRWCDTALGPPRGLRVRPARSEWRIDANRSPDPSHAPWDLLSNRPVHPTRAPARARSPSRLRRHGNCVRSPSHGARAATRPRCRTGGSSHGPTRPYDEDKGTYTVLLSSSEDSQAVKIHCSTDLLADRLATAARATSTRASIQVAAGIRITAGVAEEPVELAATDLELSLRVPLDAEVEEPGAVVIPARLAQEVVRALRADRVTLAADGPDGRVRAHRRRRRVPAAHASGRGLPAAARGRPGARLRPRPRRVPRHGRARHPGRVARRVASGADRRAGALRARPADDGRHRLLPPGGQGDRRSTTRSPSRSRRSSRPARWAR